MMKSAKKWFSLVLAFLLLFGNACAEPAYTMLDKLVYQLEAGSGLRGEFILNGKNLTFSYLDSHGVMQIVAEMDGEQLVLYHQDGKLYIISGEEQSFLDVDHDSLISEVLDDAELPGVPGFVAGLYPRVWQNINLTEWLSNTETSLDMWLSDYLCWNDTEKTPDGDTLLLTRYTVPAADFARKMGEMLTDFAQNPSLLTLLMPMMSADEAVRFADTSRYPTYASLLTGLEWSSDLEINSSYSMLSGESLSTLSLPLTIEGIPYRRADITIRGNGFAIALNGEGCSAAFDITTDDGTSSFLGTASLHRDEIDADTAFSGMLLKDETVQDDITRKGYTLLLSLTEAASGDPLADLSAEVAFRSGSAKNVSTRMELDISLQTAEDNLSLRGSAQTTAPWNMTVLDPASAVPLDGDILSVLLDAIH